MKIKFIYVLWSCFAFLSACRKSETNASVISTEMSQMETDETGSYESSVSSAVDEESDREFVCDIVLGEAFLTEDYVLYHNENGRLQIFDAVSRKNLVFCFDPGCEHNQGRTIATPQGVRSVDEGCISYNISTATVMLLGEHCYFADFEGDVVRSDNRGENRKVIGVFPSNILMKEVFYSKGALFASYNTQYELKEIKEENGTSKWIFGAEKEKRTAGIGRLNFSDGTSSEIFKREDYNASVFYHDVRGNHLYFAYTYAEIPYMGPNGEIRGEVPEDLKDLSPEEYLEEFNKRYWMDIYDYDIDEGELRIMVQKVRCGQVTFCNGFFAIQPEGDTDTHLYGYSGGLLRKLEGIALSNVNCDNHVIGFRDHKYILIDEKTGGILKSVTRPEVNAFYPRVIIGDSCYGTGTINGVYGSFYLPTEDFWAGNFSDVTAIMVEE